MKRAEILKAADECVNGARAQDRGEPEDSFGCVAEFWEVYFKYRLAYCAGTISILPQDVAAMMGLLKLARIATGRSDPDNWVDLAGYAACGGELEASDE